LSGRARGGRFARGRGSTSGRRRGSGFGQLLATLLILAALALVAAKLQQADTVRPQGRPHVNDGDTLTLAGERIRLKGIDAPERAQICRKGGESYGCGRRASDELGALIGGRSVVCEGWERDRYDRLLAVCKAGATELNRRMVEEGWAVAYGDYGDAELAARRAGKGLWAGEFDRPRDWRENHGGLAEAEHDMAGALLSWLRRMLSW
jgi:endonuclease YncB( thermonuclease family)